MKQTRKLILPGLLMAAMLVMFYGSNALADEISTGETTLTGSIYCISADGTMHGKEGVCPIDHIAHLLITNDGNVYILSGSTSIEEQIRKAPLKASSKIKVKGRVVPKLKAVDVRWWQEYETVGD